MDVSPMAHLKDSERRCIRPEQYLTAVRDQELRGPIDDIVVMPYLPGPEISFDILAVNGEMLKYAARTKLGTGRQHIVSRHPLEDLVASIVAKFSLQDRKSTRRTPVTNAHLVCRLLLEKKKATNNRHKYYSKNMYKVQR